MTGLRHEAVHAAEAGLSDLQLDALRELANIGSGHAGTALAAMLGRPVDLATPSVRVLPLADAVRATGPGEQQVTGVVVPMVGDVTGTAALVLADGDAALACGLLGVEPDGPYAASAVSELGNVLTASYLAALGQMTGLTLEPGTPSAGRHTLASLMGELVGTSGGLALALDSGLTVEDEACELSLLLVPSADGVDELLARLGV